MQTQTIEIITRLDSIEALLSDLKGKPLDLEAAADYLRVSKSHLYKLTSQKKIPYYKPTGKLVYFDKKDLDEWILQNRVDTQSEIEQNAATYLSVGKRERKVSRVSKTNTQLRSNKLDLLQ